MILTKHRMYVSKHGNIKKKHKTSLLFLVFASLVFTAQESFADNGQPIYTAFQSTLECEAENAIPLETIASPAKDDPQAESGKQKNGKNVRNMTTEEFTVYLRRMKYEDPEIYSMLIEEMDDEEYSNYFEKDLMNSENRLYENAAEITPFTLKNGKIVSGTDILIKNEEGRNILPEFLLFHIRYADGYETYVYGSDEHIAYTSESGCIRVKFLDDAEIGGTCVLTPEVNMTVEGPDADGYVIPVPGNMNVREIGRQLKENQGMITEAGEENAFGKEERENEDEQKSDY